MHFAVVAEGVAEEVAALQGVACAAPADAALFARVALHVTWNKKLRRSHTCASSLAKPCKSL